MIRLSFKKIFILISIFSFIFLPKQSLAFILYTVPTPTPTPTTAPIRYVAINTPTPTPAPIKIILINTPTPTPIQTNTIKYIPLNTSSTPKYLNLTLSEPQVNVTYPDSSSIALNGQLEQYTFTISGEDKNKQYQFRLDLYQNGKYLGRITPPPLFSLFNIDSSTSVQSAGELAGRYWPSGMSNSAIAPTGTGYKVRTVLVQNGKDVAYGESSSFAYTKSTYTVNPKIKIDSPNGGESYALDGSLKFIQFSYSGFDLYKNGNYEYQIFLYKDGKELGPVGGAQPYELNAKTDNDILGYQSGKYYDNGIKVASAGSGYTMRILVTYNGQKVAADTSDKSFSFTDSTANTNPPIVHVLSPNGGEVIPLDKDKTQNILFEQKNLDPYYGGSYKFTVKLLRNDKELGYLVSPQPFELNNKETSQALGFRATTYIDSTTFAQKSISSGGGYKVLITIYKIDSPILTDESDGTFSFGGGTNIYVNQFFTSLKEKVGNFFQLL